MTKGRQLRRSDHGTVGRDVGLIETNAGKKTLERGIAVPTQSLLVESASQFIHHVIPKQSHVGKGERVIPALVLGETEASVWRLHQSVGRRVRRRVVHTIDVVALVEVVVDPERPQVANCSPGPRAVISV